MSRIRRGPRHPRASLAGPFAVLALGALVAAGCGPAASPGRSVSAASTAGPGPSATADPSAASPSAAIEPSPAASLDGLPFPTGQAVVVPPGLYASQPPFAVPFTFEVVGADWRTWHHLVAFTDIAKYDPSEQFFLPSRWLAFAHPEAIFGPDEVPASDLDPAGAVGLWASRDDLIVSIPEPFEVDGMPGVRVDVHAPAPNTHIFGGASGDLGMQPEIDARIGIIALEEGLLLVLSLAPPAELEVAWLEVAPILASVRLAGG